MQVSLSTLNGPPGLILSANLMTVCSVTTSWSLVFQSEMLKLVVALEQQGLMFKVRGISWGKGLWVKRFCSSLGVFLRFF